MSLTSDQVIHLAKLVRLKVSEKEVLHYTQQLNAIIDLAKQMNQLDTSHIKPMSHPQDMALILRNDEVTEIDRHEEFQALAPAVESGLYLVPRVIE